MKTISTTAIVALMTASIGLGAIAPALAQDATPPAPTAETQPAPPAPGADHNFRKGPGMRQGAGMMGGGMGLLNIERGAEAIEIAIVHLSHAIDLSDEQTVLLEALKTDALAAAAAFDTATEGLRPTPPTAGETAERPNISARLDNRIAMEKAHLDALEAVQPAFTAFFDSLTDEQKAALTPAPGDREGRMAQGGKGMMQGGQHGQHGQQDGQRSQGQPNR